MTTTYMQEYEYMLDVCEEQIPLTGQAATQLKRITYAGQTDLSSRKYTRKTARNSENKSALKKGANR